MGMFGKIAAGLGQIGKYYTSPEGAQSAMSILQDYGTGDSANFRALQARRMKLAQDAQQQQALAALMGQMHGADTQTPQVNQLISETNRVNNDRISDIDRPRPMYAPMEAMPVQKAGFDPTNQGHMQSLMKYMSAGGSPSLPLAFSQMMQPEKPEYKSYNREDDVYQIDPSNGTQTMFRPGVSQDKYFNTTGGVVRVGSDGNAIPVYTPPINPLQQARVGLVKAQTQRALAGPSRGGGLTGLPPGYAPKSR